MAASKLSVFANFFIDTDERLQRMRDSCLSFAAAETLEWVVNIRGRYRGAARDFLTAELGQRLVCKDWGPGDDWFADSQRMLPHLKGDCVMFWLEDHLCVAQPAALNATVDELQRNGCDYCMYTFWWDGALRDRYRGLSMRAESTIEWFDFTAGDNRTVQSNAPEGVFIIAACAIFKRPLFEKLVLNPPLRRKWPPQTPFDFERGPDAVEWLPLRVAIPLHELFACIDDDHVHPGTSLISRGLYATRTGRRSYAAGSELEPKATPTQAGRSFARRIVSDLFRGGS